MSKKLASKFAIAICIIIINACAKNKHFVKLEHNTEKADFNKLEKPKKTEYDSICYPYTFTSRSNPIIKHIRTADPDCHVWKDGKLWMYTSQDHDPSSNSTVNNVDYSKMNGYHAFSTTDLETWTDHGEILHSSDVPWGIEEGGWMWAPGAAYKNNMYFLYFPTKDKKGDWHIGVATSKTPEGPFKAEPKFIEGTYGNDPMCFIDDDGSAYLYFAYNAVVAKLSDDMLSLSEAPRKIDYGNTNFREGAFMHKRNGIYYFSWTDWQDDVNQGYYAMGNNPYGPFEYKGAINKIPPGAQDHHSIIEYKNKWYYFYHTGNFTDVYGNEGRSNRRNVCVDYLYYNKDGTINMVKQTKKGISKIE